jgi:transcriptional regulator with XRE-family HTH domain
MQEPVQTSPYQKKDTLLFSVLMPVTIALQLGTGGTPTQAYNKLRYDVDVASAGYYRPLNDEQKAIDPQNPASDISRILQILKPSMSGLAKYLGVSRTALYDWLNGRQISAPNAAKLQNFTKAADVIAAANVQMSPIVRNRKLPSGFTLLDSIASGMDGEQAALALVDMLQEEANRRSQLTARFKNRRAISESIDDAPVIFNE